MEINIGDTVTFQRYGYIMKGRVTYVSDTSDTLMVDKIHRIKRFQVIKIHKQ